MTGVLPCGDFSMCGLLQSSNIGFASQAILDEMDEIISCPPPPSHHSWVIFSPRFAIPFSSLQGLQYGASVPRCLGDTHEVSGATNPILGIQ